jgi:hypothetical protein
VNLTTAVLSYQIIDFMMIGGGHNKVDQFADRGAMVKYHVKMCRL